MSTRCHLCLILVDQREFHTTVSTWWRLPVGSATKFALVWLLVHFSCNLNWHFSCILFFVGRSTRSYGLCTCHSQRGLGTAGSFNVLNNYCCRYCHCYTVWRPHHAHAAVAENQVTCCLYSNNHNSTRLNVIISLFFRLSYYLPPVFLGWEWRMIMILMP